MPTEAAEIFHSLLYEANTLQQQIALLTALKRYPLTGKLLTQFAQLIYHAALSLADVPPNTLDISGTGGDQCHSFNISTLAAFVIAGAGIPVAKHANRAITSRAGSIDCLQALGVVIPSNPAQACAQLKNAAICFLFSPTFHPVLAKLLPARQHFSRQGEKTIFNVLGPLVNPARVQYAAIGVYHADLLQPMAEALQLLGQQNAIVFCGQNMDEVTLTGTTHCIRITPQALTPLELDPRQLGLHYCTQDALRGGNAAENAHTALTILSGKLEGPLRDIVLLNAAVALQLYFPHEPLAQSYCRAEESLLSGAALDKLSQLQGERAIC